MPDLARCRSCQALIYWSISPAGARLPLDARPLKDVDDRITARAVVYLLIGENAVRERDLGDGAGLDDQPRYISHFQTCPHAGEHSRGR